MSDLLTSIQCSISNLIQAMHNYKAALVRLKLVSAASDGVTTKWASGSVERNILVQQCNASNIVLVIE